MTAETALPVAGSDYPVVESVTAAAYEIPTDVPEAGGVLRPDLARPGLGLTPKDADAERSRVA